MNHPRPDRIFTIEAACALVPHLSSLVERQLALGSDIDKRLRRVRRVVPADASGGLSLEPSASDSATIAEDKIALVELVNTYEAGWREVQALGVVVKDPRAGLCDFYGHIAGKLVCLCWRYGEQTITHYHDIDAGFAGRKPIAEARRLSLN